MNILQMSLAASVLIVFTAAVRFFFKNRVPKYVMNLLWGMVCLRLMIPDSFFALFAGLFKAGQTAAGGTIPGIFQVPAGVYRTAEAAAGLDLRVLKILWAVGLACMAFYFLYTYNCCIRRFRTALPVENQPFVRQWQRSNRLRRKVRVRVSDRIASPLTYGILHPVIVLPKRMDWEDQNSLYFVLTHELAHVKRWDAVWKLCLAAVLSVHWFNPLVWMMYTLANRDIELACDEKVIRTVGRKRRAAYAHVLVEWEAQLSEVNPLASYLKQNFIEERIINIMKMKKISIAGIALSMILTVGTAVVYAATPAPVSVQYAPGQKANDPTLGGIFEVYTPEEYAAVVDNVKKYSDGGSSEDIRAMEDDLARLKADNGKGEFVIYKAAFKVTEERDGMMISVGFNPTIVMAPEFVRRDAPLTADNYRKDIESVSKQMDQEVAKGNLTQTQREAIINKMYENLAELG